MKPHILSPKDACIEVVQLEAENLNACIELDKITLQGLWSKSQWEKELSDNRRVCLGVFKYKNLIALSTGWLVFDELHITAISVHPNYRRQGIAKKMLSTLLAEAKKSGVTKATLEVKAKNSAALALYENSGFKKLGERKKYYKDGDDAIIQWKSI